MRTTILAAFLLLMSNLAFAEDKSTLSLTGTGTVSVEPDQGYIGIGVAVVSPTSVEALAKNTATMQKLYSRLNDLGVSKKDIKTVDFSVGEHHSQVDSGKVDNNGHPIMKTVKDGYVVSNTIRITVCELPNFGKILDAVVQDGANQVHSISFGSSKSEEALDKAREAAVKDALRKAKILTNSLGVTLGKVSHVSEGGGYVRQAEYRNIQRMSDAPGGDVPVSGGSLSYSVNVTVQWSLGEPEVNKVKVE